MHPVIRVSLFLVFAISVSRLDLWQLIIACLILCSLFLFDSRPGLSMAGRFLLRLRWFFLTILLLYGWMTPGQSISDTVFIQQFSLEGLQAGLYQVAALVLMVLALVILLAREEKKQLMAAIYWWVYPLHWFGLSRERLVLRLMLTMSATQQLQQQLAEHQNTQAAQSRWQRLAGYALYAFRQAEQSGAKQTTNTIRIETVSSPPYWQWLYPVCVLVLFQAGSHVLPELIG